MGNIQAKHGIIHVRSGGAASSKDQEQDCAKDDQCRQDDEKDLAAALLFLCLGARRIDRRVIVVCRVPGLLGRCSPGSDRIHARRFLLKRRGLRFRLSGAAVCAELRAFLQFSAALNAKSHFIPFLSCYNSFLFAFLTLLYHNMRDSFPQEESLIYSTVNQAFSQNENSTPAAADARMKTTGCSFFVAFTTRVSTSSTAASASAFQLKISVKIPLAA